MKFGYIRVSSKTQNESRQIDTMLAQGVPKENIIIDKASGKNIEREGYQKLKEKLRIGDVVVFDSISRMSRNMRTTKKEFEWFLDKGVLLEFVQEPILNTKNNDQEDVLQRAIGEVVLTILAALAEKERDDTLKRQAEGIAAAKKRGKHLGRPAFNYQTLTYEQRAVFHQQYRLWKDEKQTAVKSFTNAGFTKSSWYKIVKQYEEISGIREKD